MREPTSLTCMGLSAEREPKDPVTSAPGPVRRYHPMGKTLYVVETNDNLVVLLTVSTNHFRLLQGFKRGTPGFDSRL